MNEPTTRGSALTDSSWGRLLGALLQPGATFRSIAARPSWVAPLVVLALIQLVTTVLVVQRIDMADAARQQLEKQAGGPVPDAQVEQVAGFQRGAFLGCAVIGLPIVYVLAALVLMVIFKLIAGEIDFKRSLSVTLHGLMPFAVAGLLSIPVVLGLDEISFEQAQRGSVLASNLSFLAPEDASPALVTVLTSLDLFSLWAVILLVLGFSIVARVSKGLAAGVIVGIWLLLVGIGAAFATLGAGMGG